MLNFCTLFDSNYLSRGLAMYYSLKETCNDFHLYIFAFDEISLKILFDLNLDNATIISLKDFESDDLLLIKPTRTIAEYCWTCTPSTIDYVLSNFKVDNCTYIDSDLIFYNSPVVLFDELKNGKNVLITEHRYSRTTSLYENNRAGRFCVQFTTFMNQSNSRDILTRWRDQCINWCFSRYEDGKFGDQKYLDEWPDKYTNVHILENIGGGLAPWNANNYNYIFNKQLSGIEKKNKTIFNIIFYHFHFVRFYNNGFVDIGWHILPNKVKKYLYRPYIKSILEIETKLKSNYPEYKPFIFKVNTNGLKELLKYLFKKITKYNVIKM